MNEQLNGSGTGQFGKTRGPYKKKSGPLTGRKQSKATIAKRMATMAAKRAAKEGEGGIDVEGARIYLKKAVRHINKKIIAGEKETPEHLLTKLALAVLEGLM